MLTLQLTALTAVLAAIANVPTTNAKHSIVHVFDTDFADLDGTIVATYDSPSYSGAKIVVNLRFTSVDFKALAAINPNCTAENISEYKWHIHNKWYEPGTRDSSSAKFDECGARITGGHYDPYKICSPGSEYADTPACAAKINSYKCTPDAYEANFASCESGDLSGKLGTLKANETGIAYAEWHDLRFPFWSEVTPAWSIVIEAVCGSSAVTPRIACSNGRKSVSDSQTRAMLKAHHSRASKNNADDAVHVAVRVATKKHD